MHYKRARGRKHLPNIWGGRPSKGKSRCRRASTSCSGRLCRFKTATTPSCLSGAVFCSGDKLKNGGGRGRFWPKSAHDSFINQLPGRVGRLNEVWWLWIMYRTDWMEQGQSRGYSTEMCFLQARWHRRVTRVPCQISVSGFSCAPIRNMLSKGFKFFFFFASTHATDPVLTRLLGVLCLPDSVLSYKKAKTSLLPALDSSTISCKSNTGQ